VEVKNNNIRKKAIIFIIILFLLFIVILLGLKKHFAGVVITGDYVVTTEKVNIYRNDEIVGFLEKDIILKVKEDKDNEQHLNIVGNNYYIRKKGIKNSVMGEEGTSKRKEYIVDLGIKIRVNRLNLLQNGNTIMTVNEQFDFDVQKMDDKYYYVYFLDSIYQIKKEEAVIVSDNKEKMDIKYLYMPVIKEKCEDENCCKEDFANDVVKLLKEKGFYFITREDYDNYQKGYISLKKDPILIETSPSNTNKQLIINNPNIMVSEHNDYDYKINRYTTFNDIEELLAGKKVKNYTGKPATSVAVLNYHFFYDASKNEKCNQSICLEKSNFEKELKYLKDNNYKTVTIEEFKDWMNKKIELPAKSVLLTVDDGAMGTSKINGNILIPLLEKYETHATLFLITGWWKKENYLSDYLDVESHSNLMHEEGFCSGKTRGAKMLCYSYEDKIKDLQNSIKKLDSKVAFCFPFYAYDSQSIKAVKEVGFEIAFIGGYRKAKQSDDKYKIPRFPIQKSLSLNGFIDLIS